MFWRWKSVVEFSISGISHHFSNPKDMLLFWNRSDIKEMSVNMGRNIDFGLTPLYNSKALGVYFEDSGCRSTLSLIINIFPMVIFEREKKGLLVFFLLPGKFLSHVSWRTKLILLDSITACFQLVLSKHLENSCIRGEASLLIKKNNELSWCNLTCIKTVHAHKKDMMA